MCACDLSKGCERARKNCSVRAVRDVDQVPLDEATLKGLVARAKEDWEFVPSLVALVDEWNDARK